MAEEKEDDLFRNLHGQIQEEEHGEALETASRLLKLVPDDPDVVKIKCTAMLHESDFKGALSFIKGGGEAGKLLFHKAYAHYRLKQHKAALDTLGRIPAEDRDDDSWHLEAQVHYRDNRFDRCVEIYEEHFNLNEMDIEAKTNLLAAYVSAGMPGRALRLMANNEAPTFESAYNTACAMLDSGDRAGAMSKLQVAQQVCRDALEADEYTEEEIKDEMAVITVQQAYLLQLEGKPKEAMEVYLQALNDKPSDEAVVATASNNVVSLRKRDEKIFDSRKRMARAANVAVSKLTPRQVRAIEMNRCLVVLYGKKGAKAAEIVDHLEQQFPNSEFPALLHASLLLREKKAPESQAVLRTYIDANPLQSTQARLTLAHLLLQQGEVEGAVAALQSLSAPLCYRPAVVATVVALNERVGSVDKANKALDEAVRFWDSSTREGEEKEDETKSMTTVKKAQLLNTLIEKSGEFKLRAGFHKEAIALFDRLLNEGENIDENQKLQLLSQLVIACAHHDPVMSAKYAARLPALPSSSGFDLEALENTSSITFTSSSKRKALLAMDDKDMDDEGEEKIEKPKKRKKRRKPRYPKGFDPANPGPPPDPERWLPRWERTQVKGKDKRRSRRDKQDLRKGAQGGAVASEDLDASFGTFGQEDSRSSKPVTATAAQRRQQRKKGRRR